MDNKTGGDFHPISQHINPIEDMYNRVDPLPPDQPECPTCGDLGMVRTDVAPGHAMFGKMLHCPANCAAARRLKQDTYDRRIKGAGLLPRYRNLTFQTFEHDVFQSHPEGGAGKVLAYSAAKLFADRPQHSFSKRDIFDFCQAPIPDNLTNLDAMKNGIVFFGKPGTGKTGLAAAIVNAIALRGEPVLYVAMYSLIADIQACYSRSKHDEGASLAELMTTFKTASVLIIDEASVHNETTDRIEKVEEIVRHRHARELSTIFTTNDNQKGFERVWGFRTAVVVSDMCHWVSVGGADLRNSDTEIVEGF